MKLQTADGNLVGELRSRHVEHRGGDLDTMDLCDVWPIKQQPQAQTTAEADIGQGCTGAFRQRRNCRFDQSSVAPVQTPRNESPGQAGGSPQLARES
jgi:hypothetical protein